MAKEIPSWIRLLRGIGNIDSVLGVQPASSATKESRKVSPVRSSGRRDRHRWSKAIVRGRRYATQFGRRVTPWNNPLYPLLAPAAPPPMSVCMYAGVSHCQKHLAWNQQPRFSTLRSGEFRKNAMPMGFFPGDLESVFRWEIVNGADESEIIRVLNSSSE